MSTPSARSPYVCRAAHLNCRRTSRSVKTISTRDNGRLSLKPAKWDTKRCKHSLPCPSFIVNTPKLLRSPRRLKPSIVGLTWVQPIHHWHHAITPMLAQVLRANCHQHYVRLTSVPAQIRKDRLTLQKSLTVRAVEEES
jgi:hypothetical protein